jgi:hypothetical protein
MVRTGCELEHHGELVSSHKFGIRAIEIFLHPLDSSLESFYGFGGWW